MPIESSTQPGYPVPQQDRPEVNPEDLIPKQRTGDDSPIIPDKPADTSDEEYEHRRPARTLYADRGLSSMDVVRLNNPNIDIRMGEVDQAGVLDKEAMQRARADQIRDAGRRKAMRVLDAQAALRRVDRMDVRDAARLDGVDGPHKKDDHH